MPRKARIDVPGALHHIIVRGIERLGRIVERTATECLAWAFIPNHFHLLLRTGSFPLAHAMRRLLAGHAIYLLYLWVVRRLDISMAELSRRWKLSTVAVSKSVVRGAKITVENDYQ